MGGRTLYAASSPRAGWPSGHHQGAGCRVGAQILTYMAFCEVSLDQFTGTAASRGDFGFKVSPHQSAGMAASRTILASLGSGGVGERPPRNDGRHRHVRPGRSDWQCLVCRARLASAIRLVSRPRERRELRSPSPDRSQARLHRAAGILGLHPSEVSFSADPAQKQKMLAVVLANSSTAASRWQRSAITGCSRRGQVPRLPAAHVPQRFRGVAHDLGCADQQGM